MLHSLSLRTGWMCELRRALSKTRPSTPKSNDQGFVLFEIFVRHAKTKPKLLGDCGVSEWIVAALVAHLGRAVWLHLPFPLCFLPTCEVGHCLDNATWLFRGMRFAFTLVDQGLDGPKQQCVWRGRNTQKETLQMQRGPGPRGRG